MDIWAIDNMLNKISLNSQGGTGIACCALAVDLYRDISLIIKH